MYKALKHLVKVSVLGENVIKAGDKWARVNGAESGVWNATSAKWYKCE
jgi:hypothetical protein